MNQKLTKTLIINSHLNHISRLLLLYSIHESFFNATEQNHSGKENDQGYNDTYNNGFWFDGTDTEESPPEAFHDRNHRV